MMVVAGMDLGAKAIKVVILSEKGVSAKVKLFPDLDMAQSARKALEEALVQSGTELHELKRIVATGTGRSAAPGKPALVTEPLADAKGIIALLPLTRTVIDVGAEEGRGVKITPQGEVVDFAVNEKCAAGSGAFMESMARSLELKIEDFGEISLKATQAVPMNAQCTVFAESEVVSFIHANTPKSDISRAVHDATASRIAAMTRRVGIEKEVALIGGVAYNPGFVEALKRTLSLETLLIPDHPDFIGALGAALIAYEQAVN